MFHVEAQRNWRVHSTGGHKVTKVAEDDQVVAYRRRGCEGAVVSLSHRGLPPHIGRIGSWFTESRRLYENLGQQLTRPSADRQCEVRETGAHRFQRGGGHLPQGLRESDAVLGHH